MKYNFYWVGLSLQCGHWQLNILKISRCEMKKIENLKNELEDTLEKLEIKSETFLDESKEFFF